MTIDWSDLALFLAVVRAGGLTAASRRSSASAPTIGRRMQRLERTLARRLFDRRAGGYELTAAGRELLAHAETVEEAVFEIERWRDHGSSQRLVRISAGSWMTCFLAENIDRLTSDHDDFRLALTAEDRRLDIARREADIGIRNRRPTEAWLAGRQVGPVAFAAYAARGSTHRDRWIVSQASTPSTDWVRTHHGAAICMEAAAPRTVLDLLLQGVGMAVLPCFIGDRTDRLMRVGDRIDALQHAQWVVTHHDDRHEPAIRRVLDRLRKLLTASRPLFEGERPNDGAG